MMEKEIVKKYFAENAESWVEDGYKDDGYNYPIGHHRRRIVLGILSDITVPSRIVDFGCGGGHLAFALAQKGHFVTAVDESKEMLRIAKKSLAALPRKVQERINFVCSSLEELKLAKNTFDAVTAMGVIGYLPNDELIFKVARQILVQNGLFLVSCRNRLFNMASITHRTIKEIESGNALSLIAEIEELYATISAKDTNALIRKLKKAVKELPDKTSYSYDMRSPSEKKRQNAYTMDIEPRQQTPKELIDVAKKFGFKHLAYYGVHPHIIAPRLNWSLPPKIYNKISEFLEAIEHLPISLIWSSVFLGVFKKQNI